MTRFLSGLKPELDEVTKNAISEETALMDNHFLDKAEELVEALRSSDEQRVDRLMSEITDLREGALYQELGMLTREIHDSINAFASDNRVAELAQDEIPDAKQRLNFIVSKTDEAAHRTMSGAEDTILLINTFGDRATSLHRRWQQFCNRELSKQEFVDLSADLSQFFETSDEETKAVHEKMNEIMLAQDYQDITGQMIKQVINMVQEIESKLIGLVSISGSAGPNKAQLAEDSGEIAVGPQLPEASTEVVAQSQGDVDDLLASLGF
ncbi:MAG: protein phosphatase CheZ [Gammaproteobacteria bacterium]|nr:protein phosphatase CheZ [Gammaproteobacteria bacterium]